ncbi:Gfo/Idh/MocA family oxidoreductase [Streptomyces sp. NPDC002773]|uniref:Gfo/Idh/MocA family protein n=1 Tax=Streptomyces sp. NPDC002773 TaxID=3154430 RepID=UPI003332B777
MEIAIVGTKRGSVHARWIAQCPEFSVTAVACSQDTEAATEVVRTYHPHAEVTTDALSLIRHGRIDAVAITTPTHSRHELVSEALDRGLLVMCEAPLAASRQSALELAELAYARDARTVVSFHLRENPALRHTRQALADGAIGRLLALDIDLHDDVHTRSAGDDVLTELGTHAFDLVPWLTRTGLWEVSSAWMPGHDAEPGAVDDFAQAELRTIGHPTRARVMVSRTGGTRPQLFVTAHGSLGVIRVRVDTADGSGLFTLSTGARDAQQLFGAHSMNPYRRLVDHLDTGIRPEPGFDDGLAALALVDAALKAGGTERWEGRVS